MSIETIKSNLIQRLQAINEESIIQQLEKMLTRIEMDNHAREATADYHNGDYQELDDFSEEMRTWLKNRNSIK